MSQPEPHPAPSLPEWSRVLDQVNPGWNDLPPSDPAPSPSSRPRSSTPDETETRAIEYLNKLPPAIQGRNGSGDTLWAARVVCWGFDLGEDDGFRILTDHYNPRCEPPWSDAELRKKCRDAMNPNFKHPRGWLRDAESPHAPKQPRTSFTVTSLTTSPPPPPPLVIAPGRPARMVNIQNFARRSKENGEETRVGITPQQILREILAATGGWPKACDEKLFVPGPDHTPIWLPDATAFFSWLAGYLGLAGGMIEWGRCEGMIPKAEFFAFVVGQVDQYQDVQTYPHFPPRSGTYYLHPEIGAGGTGAFDELLDQLRPATDADRALVRAFFLTLAWGGRLGGRPIFIFEAATEDGRPGQGAGKSTAAMLGGKLFGGYLNISLATADDMQVQTRLLSKHGRRSRLVVFDNLKGTRVSNSLIESYVTADIISGRQLWQGEGTRPNNLTWTITANQPSLSRDFVGRAYPVRVTPPTYTPAWTARIDALIAEHRWAIIGDIIAELRADPVARLADGEWSRWPEWEHEVLCRVCDPRPLAEVVAHRRQELDDDNGTALLVRESLAEFIKMKRGGLDPETLHLILSSTALAEGLGKLCPHGANPIVVGRWANTLTVPGLRRGRDMRRKYWVWRGSDAISDEPIEMEEIPL
jgi:hypothetical protein